MSLDLDAAIRKARGKVLALLLRKDFDIIVAEDAVGAAIEVALTSWPKFPPVHPEAWLMAVALRKALDQTRRSRPTVSLDDISDQPVNPSFEMTTHIPDERLRLYFLCTHPALDSSLQCPLMLQLVVGMTVEQISELYLVPAPAMAQRLVRAKRKIRDAGILPRLPEAAELQERVIPVLHAIYGLYFNEWRGAPDVPQALELAMILGDLLPQHAEALGLVALNALCDSRRASRSGPLGEYIPLEEQDTSHWKVAKIELGEAYLRQASQLASPGRFQIEAALQSAHIHRRLNQGPPWSMIVQLYDRLLAHAPTAGFYVGRAAALARADGPAEGLAQLDALVQANPDLDSGFAPYLVARAHFLAELERIEEARIYAARAASLSASPAEREYLIAKFALDDVAATSWRPCFVALPAVINLRLVRDVDL
ncbi:MAG: RNA polymerase sigma factor [Fimbriimonas sp.]